MKYSHMYIFHPMGTIHCLTPGKVLCRCVATPPLYIMLTDGTVYKPQLKRPRKSVAFWGEFSPDKGKGEGGCCQEEEKRRKRRMDLWLRRWAAGGFALPEKLLASTEDWYTDPLRSSSLPCHLPVNDLRSVHLSPFGSSPGKPLFCSMSQSSPPSTSIQTVTTT